MKDTNNSNDPVAKSDPGHSAGLVMQVYLIIIGLAFGFAIQAFVDNPATVGSVFRLVAMFVLLSEWLHGQIGYEDSATYAVGRGWVARLAEHYVELAGVALLMAAALVLDRPTPFLVLVTLTYTVDAVLEMSYLRRTSGAKVTHGEDRDVAKSWLRMDVIAVLILVPLSILAVLGVAEDPFTSVVLFGVVLGIALWDYARNRAFYFGLR